MSKLGGGLFSSSTGQLFSPKKVEVNAKIVDFISEVSVTHYYSNNKDLPIDAVFWFPVEEGAAVTSFKAKFGNQEVVTEVKERKVAKAAFAEATKHNRKVPLLEEIKPDIFKISLGQLMPGDDAEINVKFIFELSLDDLKTRFAIPMSITSRYAPKGYLTPNDMEIASISHKTFESVPISFNINCDYLENSPLIPDLPPSE